MTQLKPEYETYEDKPTVLISGSYTTVRGAELREMIRFLDERGGGIPVSNIQERFARSHDGVLESAHVDDSLGLLQALDFVAVSSNGVVSQFNDQVFSTLSFEAKFLSHIRQQSGRSEHLAFISEVLSKMNKRRISTSELLETVRAEDTGTYSDQLSWNEDKIRFWANLLDPLGALSYTSGADVVEIIASPTRALLAELLDFHASQSATESAVEAFQWIDQWVLPIFTERAGNPRLSTGVADTLYSMEEDGYIDLVRESDAQSIVEVPSSGGRSRSVSSLVMGENPHHAAYTYPLDRTTWRGVP